MTAPFEDEARALIELIDEIDGRIRHQPGCHECDLFRRVAAALAPRVSTPPSEDWEYGFGWTYLGRLYGSRVDSLERAQQIVAQSPPDDDDVAYLTVRRRKPGPPPEWEPVPAVPVLPTEPETVTQCPKCAVKVTDQTPSAFYASHDETCGGDLCEPTEPEEKR